MSPLVWIVGISVVFVLLYIRSTLQRNARLLPPGPPGLPFLGNMHQIARNAPKQFSQWAHQYGKLYTVYLGSYTPALVLSDPKLIKELYGKFTSTGTFYSELIQTLFDGNNGVGNLEGKHWQEQHAFCVKTLQKFGFGKDCRVEPMILSEIEDFCAFMDDEMQTNGKVYIEHSLKKASGNTLWTIVTGQRMETNVTDLVQELLTTLQTASMSGLAFLPWMKSLAPEWSGYNAYLKAVKRFHQFVAEYFKEHVRAKESGFPHHHDIISEFIDHVHDAKDKESSFYGKAGLLNSFHSVLSLLIGGTEPTAAALNWLIFYLSAYPEVQKKVQEEVEVVVGEYRDAKLEDRDRMPFTEALIQETLRRSSLSPFGAVHSLLEDITFHGYKLPKGLALIANIFHVNNNPNIWGDPENFRPERFLSQNNSTIANGLRENILGFQVGRRRCLGENIARDLMFLFSANIVKKFTFSPAEKIEAPEYMQPQIGFFMLPKNLPVLATRRVMK